MALLLMNGAEFTEAYFALGKIGAVVVPLNWRLVPDELAFILKDAGGETADLRGGVHGPGDRTPRAGRRHGHRALAAGRGRPGGRVLRRELPGLSRRGGRCRAAGGRDRRRHALHHVHVRYDRTAEGSRPHPRHVHLGMRHDRGDHLLPGSGPFPVAAAHVPRRGAHADHPERLPGRHDRRDAQLRSRARVGAGGPGAGHRRPGGARHAQLHAAGPGPRPLRLLAVAVVHVGGRPGPGVAHRGLCGPRSRNPPDLRTDGELRPGVPDRCGERTGQDRLDRQGLLSHGRQDRGRPG